MKLVFFTMPAQSHLNPTLGVIRELIKQGHEIVVYNVDEFEKKITDSGASFRSYHVDLPELQSGLGKNPLVLVDFLVQAAEKLTEPLLSEILKEKPDGIIHDSLNLWGKIIAQAAHVPAVCLSPTFIITPSLLIKSLQYLYTDYWEILSHPVKTFQIRQRYRSLYKNNRLAPPNVFDLLANPENLTLIFTSTYFQPSGSTFNSRYKFVGPIIYNRNETNELNLERVTHPIIYISLGTIYNIQQQFYQKWIEFFREKPYKVFISVGKHIDVESFRSIPDNIVVKNYLPQLEILSKSSVFITHGGMNSINESLYYEVPMILFPQMHEQRINALRVQELKAGICVTKNELIMSEMEHFFSAIVSDNSYRQHANKIGETLRSAGGSQKAVELINTYISK